MYKKIRQHGFPGYFPDDGADASFPTQVHSLRSHHIPFGLLPLRGFCPKQIHIFIIIGQPGRSVLLRPGKDRIKHDSFFIAQAVIMFAVEIGMIHFFFTVLQNCSCISKSVADCLSSRIIECHFRQSLLLIIAKLHDSIPVRIFHPAVQGVQISDFIRVFCIPCILAFHDCIAIFLIDRISLVIQIDQSDLPLPRIRNQDPIRFLRQTPARHP